jgi:HK97 gp10 family phage protein
MADGLEITVTGLSELDAAMADLGSGDAVEQVCRRALREGGNVMKAAIAANAPVRPDLPSGTALPPGALQSDITVTVSKDSDNSFSAWIEPGKFTRHVARFVEYGHELIHGKNRKAVGDVRAHPYIRPAFDANEDLAVDAVSESISRDISAVARQRGL